MCTQAGGAADPQALQGERLGGCWKRTKKQTQTWCGIGWGCPQQARLDSCSVRAPVLLIPSSLLPHGDHADVSLWASALQKGLSQELGMPRDSTQAEVVCTCACEAGEAKKLRASHFDP